MKISVITVCYNCVNEIESTITSVLSQTYFDVEYIIIDGGSIDGTVDIIRKYEDEIDYWLSEKDRGIYDAMNKGFSLSNGKWINFMNAGDTFYSNLVLENVFSNYSSFNKKAILYGYKYQNQSPIYPFSLNYLEKGIIMANHQSMFFNSDIIKNQDLRYDLRFPIYADYELVNRIYLNFGKSFFMFINIPIAAYQGGGVSSKISGQKRLDKIRIVLENYGIKGLIRSIVFRLF